MDLGVVSSESDAESMALGMNDLGQVVGWTHVSFGSGQDLVLVPRAFFWTPADVAYDTITFAAGELHVLLSPGEDAEDLDAEASVARAINEQSQIVGARSSGESIQTPMDGRAFIWLPTGGLTSNNPPSFTARVMELVPGLSQTWSDAWDIGDAVDDEVRVVGFHHVAGEACGSDLDFLGFAWESDARSAADLPPIGSRPHSAGLALPAGSLLGAVPDRVLGTSLDFCDTGMASCGFGSGLLAAVSTEPYAEPVFGNFGTSWAPTWSGSLVETADEFTGTWVPDRITFVLGVNDALAGVGAGGDGTTDPQSLQCLELPLYWGDVTSDSAEILPTPMDGDDREEAEAWAINELGQIVGINTTSSAATHWTWDESESGWVYLELGDVVDTSSCGWASLRRAIDINDGVDGSKAWICGDGRRATLSRRHAFVLVPIGPCDYDITRDGTVDFDDYLEVLSAWGDCPVATVCWADLDGDCAVGQSDLTIVLSHWSESCTESAQSLPSAVELLMGAWLAAGGLDAIEQGMISIEALAETIGTTPTVDGVLDLFELLEDEE